MAMLHPKFNHLGRSRHRVKSDPSRPKKKSILTKVQIQAREEHAAFLRSVGLPEKLPRRIKLKGAVPLENAAHNPRRPELAPTSGFHGGWAPKRSLF